MKFNSSEKIKSLTETINDISIHSHLEFREAIASKLSSAVFKAKEEVEALDALIHNLNIKRLMALKAVVQYLLCVRFIQYNPEYDTTQKTKSKTQTTQTNPSEFSSEKDHLKQP